MKTDENFLLGLCQMATRVAKEENLRQAQQMVQQAAREGCRLVVLPEMFSCPYQAVLFPEYAEPAEGETVSRMSAWARESGVVLVGGSIPECDEAGRVYNTSFVFDEQGVLLGRHRKMHLFDVDIAGGTCFRESDTLTAGNELTLCETSVGVLGVGICYDMRFGAMAGEMVRRGADLLIYPAAFGWTTGPAHWELTLRARAVDHQVFVVGAAPAKLAGSVYEAYGHSLVADPWGRILFQADETEQLVKVEIDRAVQAKVRAELPLLQHLRGDYRILSQP